MKQFHGPARQAMVWTTLTTISVPANIKRQPQAENRQGDQITWVRIRLTYFPKSSS
jgi:hypothetical protein